MRLHNNFIRNGLKLNFSGILINFINHLIFINHSNQLALFKNILSGKSQHKPLVTSNFMIEF